MAGEKSKKDYPGSEELMESYTELLETIKRNMDPNSNTVLIVDDERGIRMKVARDVRSFDPTVVTYEASNGQEALKKLKDIRRKYYRDPLLIILDLQMPIMDGWETIKSLKKEYESEGKSSGIPIIVLSSSSGEKGTLLGKTSVHDGKTGYEPLVSVAKEACIDKHRYDVSGEKGLITWLKYFLRAR